MPRDRSVTNFANSDGYRAEIHDLIAGGAHTYSKGDDQFPRLSPAAIARGKGGRVWDVDGNEYVDCALGLGAVSLGHAYEPVLAAVRETLELGSAFQRPAAIERELAREFLALCPGMDRIKFCKNGSNATTAAVKLARAHTGRPFVAFPMSHPFFSFDDWFIGTTLTDNGVPDLMSQLSLRYDSTRPETLKALFDARPGQIACVITEPEEAIPLPPETIHRIQAITHKGGALFILDEMVTGFRAGFPGSYTTHGYRPDLTTWGKAVGNGFSFCAVAGKADVMELGGIRQTGQPRVFLLSSTHGGEAHVLAAALATLRAYRDGAVLAHQQATVAKVAHGVTGILRAHGLTEAIAPHVSPWRIVFVFKDAKGQVSADYRTLMLQEMIGRGMLYQGVFLPCFAHTADDVTQFLEAFDSSCQVYARALGGGVGNFLVGEAARPVFRKYNGCRQTCPPGTPCPHETRCRS